MDRTDEKILDLLKGNARMSFQELGNALGMSRVAAKKRVTTLASSSEVVQSRAGIPRTEFGDGIGK